MKRKTTRIALNAFIAAAVLGAWLWLAFTQDAPFAATFVKALRYFAMLSNVFAGAAAIVFIVALLRSNDGTVPRAVSILKFVACVEITVTFATVIFFLTPIWGFLDMMSGANLFLHLIIPLTAIAEFIIFECVRPTIRENLFTVVPVLVYGAGYVLNVLINGIGEYPETNDWYGFLHWGWGFGAIILSLICGIAFFAGLLLRLTKRKTETKSSAA